MIRNNYHTHTFRCGHAIGNDEEYVLEAIALGLNTLGFSDHVMLPNVKQELENTKRYWKELLRKTASIYANRLYKYIVKWLVSISDNSE
mgnify:CR=1 FL=1